MGCVGIGYEGAGPYLTNSLRFPVNNSKKWVHNSLFSQCSALSVGNVSQLTLPPESFYILLRKETGSWVSPGREDAIRHFRQPGLPCFSWGIWEFLPLRESHQDNIAIHKKSQMPLAIKIPSCPKRTFSKYLPGSVSHEKGMDQWVVTPC